MSAKNTPNYLIAATVIVCSVILLAALTIALRGFAWAPAARTLEIDFIDSTGIRLHSAVRYAGAPAGSVTRIRYLTPAERRASKDPKNAVRVAVALQPDVPPIPSEATAALSAETILGEKFIALSPGNPDAPPLPPGAVIQGRDSTDFDSLTRSAQAAMERVNDLLTRVNQDYPMLVPKLSDLLSQGNSLLLQGSNFVHNADGTITNANDVVTKFKADYNQLAAKLDALLGQGKTIASNADTAIQRIGTFASHADLLVTNNEANLHEILAQLRVVSQNLKVISTYTKTLTGTLAEKPSRLIWSWKKSTLPSEEEILHNSEPLSPSAPAK